MKTSVIFDKVESFALNHGWTIETVTEYVSDYPIHHSVFEPDAMHGERLHMFHNPDGVAVAWWGDEETPSPGTYIRQSDHNRSPILAELLAAVETPFLAR